MNSGKTGAAFLLAACTIPWIGYGIEEWFYGRADLSTAFWGAFAAWGWTALVIFALFLAVLHYEYFWHGAELDSLSFERASVWVMTLGVLLFAYVYYTSISAHRESTELRAFLNQLVFDDALKACEASAVEDGKRFAYRDSAFKQLHGVEVEKTRFGMNATYVLRTDQAVCIYDPLTKSAELHFFED
jgi:hypothetical protein